MRMHDSIAYYTLWEIRVRSTEGVFGNEANDSEGRQGHG